jgi:tellurite resistance protein
MGATTAAERGKFGRDANSTQFIGCPAVLAQYTAAMKIVSAPPSATVIPITPTNGARPWLARLPPGLFAIALGLLGLAGAWQRLAGLALAEAGIVSTGLLQLATGLFGTLFVLQVVKEFRHREACIKDRAHPVQGAMLSLLPLCLLLSVALWLPSYPELREVAQSAAVAALVLQAFVVASLLPRVARNEIAADMLTPALYLPPVGGGLIGALALNALGAHSGAALLFGMGVGAWALLEARVLNRLFAGPLPPPLRATIGVEIAPAPVTTLVAATLWPSLPAEVLLIGLGVSCVPLLGVLARWRWWTSVPFSAGFWSFSFPAAAMASVAVEVVLRGGWPKAVAYGAVFVATLLVAYLTVRTLMLLFRGRLLPPG